MEFFLDKLFPEIEKKLKDEIISTSKLIVLEKNTELLRAGQYVKWIPMVVNGVVKVFTQFEEKELLLYYIRPEESCIMSFSACLKNEKSKVFAITEEKSKVFLLPAFKIKKWLKTSPPMNLLFFQLFNLRYIDLLDTINHLVYHKLDIRLLNYLKLKQEVTGKNLIKITHRQIAEELGTAREVISRVIKKMEGEKLISQKVNGIKILKR